jgi:TetR/AcrR family transcriptional regulator, regulator of cefoperazone and chloramphenicol sensitivity
MNLTPPASSARGDATRDALVAAAMPIFGRDGFHAASTRAIAEAAGVNPALIGYHFRGKEGLYLAVFEHIVQQLRVRMGPVAAAIEAELGDGEAASLSRERALALLRQLTDRMVALMAQEQTATWAQLILREQQAPSAAFNVLYEGFMGRLLTLLTRLMLCVRGGDEAEARLLAVTLVGQVQVFRTARAGVLRHLGWSRIGDEEIAAAQRRVFNNLSAQLATADAPSAGRAP